MTDLKPEDRALIERLEVTILEIDGIIRGSQSPIPYTMNDVRSILGRVIAETKEVLDAARAEGLRSPSGGGEGEEGFIPERVTGGCADAGPCPHSLERVMRTLYSFDPIQEQPVDADLRPVGEAGNISFDDLEWGYPLAWSMLKDQGEKLLKAALGNGAPTITLECPKCHRTTEAPRDEFDPSAAVKSVIICPDCDDGDFHEQTFFDAEGEELDWETGLPFPTPDGGEAVHARPLSAGEDNG